MLLSIIYVHVLVYWREVIYVVKHYICTCASLKESSKELSVLQMGVESKCSDIIHLYTKWHNSLLKYNFNITAKIAKFTNAFPACYSQFISL